MSIPLIVRPDGRALARLFRVESAVRARIVGRWVSVIPYAGLIVLIELYHSG